MKPWQASRPASRSARFILAAVVVLLGGCLIVPVPEYDAAGSRGNITKETSDQFQTGVTTKEDVLLQLGEPDYATDDGRQIGYEWTRVKAWWFVGGGYSGAAGEVLRSYLLRLTFDEEDRFVRSDLMKEWGGEVSPKRVARTE
jgi:hypothetical protein